MNTSAYGLKSEAMTDTNYSLVMRNQGGDKMEYNYKSFDDLPPCISIPQAAKLLGVSDRHLYNFLRKGSDFPVIEIGRRKIVPSILLKDWVEKNCKK